METLQPPFSWVGLGWDGPLKYQLFISRIKNLLISWDAGSVMENFPDKNFAHTVREELKYSKGSTSRYHQLAKLLKQENLSTGQILVLRVIELFGRGDIFISV